ncbi:MAG: sigma-70 family RNA polymerase sigma factor [Acidimicrobiia bacterium]|nr:sigma-70 family RNA polymerase sigma factor [Acidimicrobiia bacterium]NNF10669.1 sigma-70 family RNA polymerase sigma factor [Acidimicrobiia bacterium]NNL70887.1 sigma-70 family RNA polymerase sigma factor [Acidimicrobiia bacterium]
MTAQEAESFDGMYAACVRPVLAYCLRRTSEAEAHDATAEVFAVAWRRRDQVPLGDETVPWLIGVAANVLRNQGRSSRRTRNLAGKLGSQPQQVQPGPEAQVVRRVEYAEVQRAISSLKPDYREVIKLVEWDEIPREVVAEMLSVSRAAIDQRLHRAYKQLERKLRHLSPYQVKGGEHDAATAT